MIPDPLNSQFLVSMSSSAHSSVCLLLSKLPMKYVRLVARFSLFHLHVGRLRALNYFPSEWHESDDAVSLSNALAVGSCSLANLIQEQCWLIRSCWPVRRLSKIATFSWTHTSIFKKRFFLIILNFLNVVNGSPPDWTSTSRYFNVLLQLKQLEV